MVLSVSLQLQFPFRNELELVPPLHIALWLPMKDEILVNL